MNFLAHLYLARGDEGLMLGALLGDYVRGRRELNQLAPPVRDGVRLHRRIDRFTDQAHEIKALRRQFPQEFRRYAGIVIDLGFDHELARQWHRYSEDSLEALDREVRQLLARHEDLLPRGLRLFMRYADNRGLFAAYRYEDEVLFSLAGIGMRLKRANPLHRVGEIWPELKPHVASAFKRFFPRLQSEVADWRKRRSTTTGS